MVSVTTSSLPAAALKTSPSGQKASRCCQGRYLGMKFRLELEVLARVLADQRLQLLEHLVRFGEAALRHGVLVMHDLGAHDPVDGRLVDTDLAQAIGQLIPVGTAEEVGRRALQHGDLGRLLAEGWHNGGGGRARADDQHPLAGVFSLRVPQLGVDEPAPEVGKPWPVGDIGAVVIVVALAHP